jgi:hypothetical protein
MSKTTNRKKSLTAVLGMAAATLAAPAMLLAGSGTAQAASSINTVSDPMGVTVEVHSTGSSGLCFYRPSRGSDGTS